jgi:hypothetical protein
LAVTSVTEIHEGRGSSESLDGKTRTRVFQVLTDNPLDDAAVVLASPLLPAKLAPYITDTTQDLTCRVRDRRADQQGDHPQDWRVTIEYDTRFDQKELESIENPLARPVEVSYGSNKFALVAEKDLVTSDAVVNSAYERFDPPPERRVANLVLHFKKNFADFVAVTLTDYLYTTNSKIFYGFDAGRVLCTDIQATLKNDNNVSYWEVSFEFEVAKKTWKLELLDQGFWYFDTDAAKFKNFADDAGQPASKPRLLNGQGDPLANPITDDPVFLSFTIYESKNFDDLKIF